MKQDIARQLRWTVESRYGCKALRVDDERVHIKEGTQTQWYGTVTVFEISGHATAKKAYGWCDEMPGTGEMRFLSSLDGSNIASAADAVLAELSHSGKHRPLNMWGRR